MPTTLVLVRILAFAAVIGISAVVLALAAHFSNFGSDLDGVSVMLDNTLETYALVVGVISIIIILPM
jgi:DMSO/TMAO reductase YedYZ heme-binding membrane subunit